MVLAVVDHSNSGVDEYKAIAKLLAEKRLDRDRYIHDVVETLKGLMEAQHIHRYDVSGRAKHIYSIWRKMKRKRIDFSQVHDVRAVRILVPEVTDCYTVLGIVHSRWHHVPNEFDDYIANPKKKRPDFPTMPPQDHLSEPMRQLVAEYMLALTN